MSLYALLLCYDLLKEKAEHLCYQNRDETEYHPAEYNKPGSKRKLTIWQELTIVLLRLRLGLLEKDLAERFRISMPTVSVIWRTWIKFMRKELEPVCIQWPSKDQLHGGNLQIQIGRTVQNLSTSQSHTGPQVNQHILKVKWQPKKL